jgi:hypothetical protein
MQNRQRTAVTIDACWLSIPDCVISSPNMSRCSLLKGLLREGVSPFFLDFAGLDMTDSQREEDWKDERTTNWQMCAGHLVQTHDRPRSPWNGSGDWAGSWKSCKRPMGRVRPLRRVCETVETRPDALELNLIVYLNLLKLGVWFNLKLGKLGVYF